MTLGQRLCELRTGKGLSQLELAEALDVSRQSVSKWETDAAVPEIDKLIAISRYFGVSIGVLLGVEPEEGAEEAAPDGELTETQLKMVEEIVARYVAALPKPLPKPWKLALRIAAAVALVCLAAGLFKIFGQLSELHQNYNNLANSVSIVNANVNGITGRVEAMLEQQASLTTDASAKIVSADVTGKTLTLAVRAVPKLYVDGMTAYFEVENDGARESFGPCEPDGTSFSTELTTALTDDISLYVVFEHDGQRETQLLDYYGGLYSGTLPTVYVDDMPGYTYYWNGSQRAKASGDWYVTVRQGNRAWGIDESDALRQAETVSIEVGLFRDHELLWRAEQMDGAPAGWNTIGDADVLYYRYPNSADAFAPDGAFTKGGKLRTIARVTDEYGRVFLFTAGEGCYTLAENGTLNWCRDTETEWEGTEGYDSERIKDPSAWNFTPIS